MTMHYNHTFAPCLPWSTCNADFSLVPCFMLPMLPTRSPSFEAIAK